jgi:DNA uptake protein ComE-like DNA-binding protein
MGKLRVDPVRRHVVGWARIALGVVACAGPAVAAGVGPGGAPAPAGHASAASKKGAPAAPVKLIDINSASRAQLKTLPGIGDAEADKIVAGRPYLSKARLVTEAGLPVGTYLSIKNQIVAMQNKEARAKLKALAKAQQAQQAQPR